jgi:hypothetical protein
LPKGKENFNMTTPKIGRTSDKAFNILRRNSLGYSQIRTFGSVTTDYKILSSDGDYSTDVKRAIVESICSHLNIATGDLWVPLGDYLTAHRINNESGDIWHRDRVVRCEDGLQIIISVMCKTPGFNRGI